jgi:hypothetical protein
VRSRSSQGRALTSQNTSLKYPGWAVYQWDAHALLIWRGLDIKSSVTLMHRTSDAHSGWRSDHVVEPDVYWRRVEGS